jgi:hypothetical protein
MWHNSSQQILPVCPHSLMAKQVTFNHLMGVRFSLGALPSTYDDSSPGAELSEMPLKTCVTCGESRHEVEFAFRYQRLDHRWGTCKECQKKQRKAWYERNKETHIANVNNNRKNLIQKGQQYVWDYLLLHPCVECGETDPVVLEFDHVRGEKRMAVGDLARLGYGVETIKVEIAKCEVRCANCHRRKTHSERGWFRG